ncbi:hypothetical protein PL11201_410054 [Planktothrix sp. PCC 11201]|nr:hypothetical protein PL11201_410054 [Planktothrix sp. PCC 11201]
MPYNPFQGLKPRFDWHQCRNTAGVEMPYNPFQGLKQDDYGDDRPFGG